MTTTIRSTFHNVAGLHARQMRTINAPAEAKKAAKAVRHVRTPFGTRVFEDADARRVSAELRYLEQMR